jgi:hypothetical protein
MARQELAFEKKNHGKKISFDNEPMLETQNQNHLFLASCIEQVSYSCNLLAFRVPFDGLTT